MRTVHTTYKQLKPKQWNKRGRKPFLYQGKSFAEWSEETGVPAVTLRQRFQAGWRGKKLFEPVKRGRNQMLYQGKTWKQWSEETGVSAVTLYTRWRRGESHENIVNPNRHHAWASSQIYTVKRHKGNVTELCEKWFHDVPPATVYMRLRHGWDPVDAFTVTTDHGKYGSILADRQQRQ